MKKITLNVEFEYGDIVFLKTDMEQLPRMVTCYIIRDGYIIYELTQGASSSTHFGVEITREVDVFTKINYQ